MSSGFNMSKIVVSNKKGSQLHIGVLSTLIMSLFYFIFFQEINNNCYIHITISTHPLWTLLSKLRKIPFENFPNIV